MKQIMRIILAASAICGLSASASADEPDEAIQEGKIVFKKCAVCHTLEPERHKIGPSLAGLFGRQAGSAKGYSYSTDMKAAGTAGLVWNEETLADYIKKDGQKGPKTYIGEVIGKKRAKTKMPFPGLSKDEDIQNLIAYLGASGAASD